MSVKYIRKGLPPGKKPEPALCIACAGSGRYDHNGSPKCGACNGSGLENPADRR